MLSIGLCDQFGKGPCAVFKGGLNSADKILNRQNIESTFLWSILTSIDWPLFVPQLLLFMFQKIISKQRLYKPSRSNVTDPHLSLFYYPLAFTLKSVFHLQIVGNWMINFVDHSLKVEYRLKSNFAYSFFCRLKSWNLNIDWNLI